MIRLRRRRPTSVEDQERALVQTLGLLLLVVALGMLALALYSPPP
jgi:hypothetical protein